MDIPADVKEALEKILVKNPEELTDFEKAFLNARRDYLNNEQKRVFASVLRTTEELHEETVATQTEQATDYVDPEGNAVTEQVDESSEENPEAPVDNVPAVEPTTAGDVQEAPVQPAEPTPPVEQVVPEAPATPTEQPVTPQEPVTQGQVQTNGGEVTTAATNENPFDVNVAEKDPDA